jgi:hypothetical protein
LIAVNAAVGQVAWLDARRRSHVHVEDDVKQAKAIGMNRWPSRHWKVNVAWIAMVAMAASLLAAFRHLGLPDGDLRTASIGTLRFRLFEVPARITYGQRKTWLHLPADWPWTPDLIHSLAVPTTLESMPRHVEPGANDATVGPRPCPPNGIHDQKVRPASEGQSLSHP